MNYLKVIAKSILVLTGYVSDKVEDYEISLMNRPCKNYKSFILCPIVPFTLASKTSLN